MKKPDFPKKFVTDVVAFPVGGNDVGILNCLARIPLYTLEEDPEKKERLKQKFFESEQKKINEAIEFYSTINVDDKFHSPGRPEISIRISKISVKNDTVYINLCATKQHQEYAKSKGYKPVKSQRWQLEIFHSLIKGQKLIRF